jgi:hypothetical protein
MKLILYGEVAERFKALVLKTSDAATHRGFESHPLRHMDVRQLLAAFFVE